MSWPEVWIVVLNWNRAKDTEECLKSVFDLDYSNYKVILVDNGSREPASLSLNEKFPSLIFLRNEENLGFAGGNNVGIRYALEKGADYIFLLNNDVVVDRFCLKELIKVAVDKPRIGAIGPSIYFYAEPQKVYSSGGRLIWWKGRLAHARAREVREIDFLTACALLVKREVIEKVGLLEPAYFLYYEDVEWGVKMNEAGFKVIFCPQAKVWHKVSQTSRVFSEEPYYRGRNRLLFMKRNAKERDWWIFIVLIFPLVILKNFFRYLFNPKGWKYFVEGICDFKKGQLGPKNAHRY